MVLKESLMSDLSFSRHYLRKDLKGFLKHAVRLAEAFQLVDFGPPKNQGRKDADTDKRTERSRSGTK